MRKPVEEQRSEGKRRIRTNLYIGLIEHSSREEKIIA
jgi:hypothetical protein